MNRDCPGLPYNTFTFFILSYPLMLSFFSQCNILVLITANKGKHSVMGEEREKFGFPGEPDSSLFPSSHYKSCGSFSGWMTMPCVNISLSWLQRSSRRTALLLLTAMVPNSVLQWSTSIARAVIQYQFGLRKEFVIHQSFWWHFTLSAVWANTIEGLSPSRNATHIPTA